MIVEPLFGAIGITAGLVSLVGIVGGFVAKQLWQAATMVAKITAAIVGVLVMLIGPIQWMLNYMFDAFPEFSTGLQSWVVYLGYMQPWIDIRLFFFLLMSSVTYVTTITVIRVTSGLIRGGR